MPRGRSSTTIRTRRATGSRAAKARRVGPLEPNWLVERIAARHIEEAVLRWGGGRALDVGCGAQPYAPFFSDYTGLEYDLQRYGQTPPAICGSALELPFAAGSFDTVFSSQVLEHVPEPWRMVEEMARVLKPGGHLIISAPHIWGLHEVPHDYFRFTCYGLAYLAQRVGLEVLEVRPMAGYWVTTGTRFCYYLRPFQRRIFGPLMGPVYAAVHYLSWALDRLHRVDSDAWNYLLVAQRPEPGA
jgi:SAM-dependent methyltransferase